MSDLVIHPSHYNKNGKKECWDEMLEKFGAEAVVIFDCLSAYKYNYRAGSKDGNPEEQDRAKIDNYMKHSGSLIPDTPCYGLARDVYSKVWNELDKE